MLNNSKKKPDVNKIISPPQLLGIGWHVSSVSKDKLLGSHWFGGSCPDDISKPSKWAEGMSRFTSSSQILYDFSFVHLPLTIEVQTQY